MNGPGSDSGQATINRGATRTGFEIARRDGGTIELSSGQLESLASRVEGRLLTAGDDGWEDAVLLWNGMVARKPALVAQPASSADVAAMLDFAREHGLLVSVKGGGHNIGGTAIAEGGLTLDMSSMAEVEVDAEAKLVRFGPGCLLGDVDAATQEHGLATVLGFVSRVGAAGLVLGGGLGYLTRRFGWAVDNLEEVEIVTADGRIRVANREQEPDLFWAIRGGGGNFGVVTRFSSRLHEVGPTVHGGLIAWPFERVGEVLAAYRGLTAAAPRELSVWCMLMNAPPAPFVPEDWHGKPVCAMAVCYSGDRGEAEQALAPVRGLGEPIFDLLAEQPYTEVQSYLDETEPKGAHYYWKTEFVAELDDLLLETMSELFAGCPIPEGQIGLLHLGGALNERPADDGAIGNRDARFALGALGMWEPGEPEEESYVEWVRDAWRRLRHFSTGGNYVNFQTADEDEDRIRATYGPNFERLREIKRSYDPDNVLRSNRNVRPL